MKVPVTGPVFAECGPIDVRVFEARHEFIPPDDGEDWPWAVGALCHVTFWFGDRRRSKRVTSKVRLGMEQPTLDELTAASGEAVRMVRDEMRRHGFEPPEDLVVNWGDPEWESLGRQA